MKFIYALEWMLGDKEWEQLDLFSDPAKLWVGPMMWPSDENVIEKVIDEFYNSLQGRQMFARVIGHYEKEGDKWQLIPLQ